MKNKDNRSVIWKRCLLGSQEVSLQKCLAIKVNFITLENGNTGLSNNVSLNTLENINCCQNYSPPSKTILEKVTRPYSRSSFFPPRNDPQLIQWETENPQPFSCCTFITRKLLCKTKGCFSFKKEIRAERVMVKIRYNGYIGERKKYI